MKLCLSAPEVVDREEKDYHKCRYKHNNRECSHRNNPYKQIQECITGKTYDKCKTECCSGDLFEFVAYCPQYNRESGGIS